MGSAGVAGSGKKMPPRCSRGGDIFDEYRPLLRIMQLAGVAPFSLRAGRPAVSRMCVAYFLVHASCLSYCLYDSLKNRHFSKLSRYTFTVLVYDISGIARSLYAIATIIKFLCNVETSLRVWTTMDDMNRELSRIGCEVPRRGTRNAAILLAFLVLYGLFVAFTYNLQTRKSKLTTTFWLVWYVPLFQSCIMEFSFSSNCLDLAGKFSASNRILEEEGSSRPGRFECGTSCRRLRALRRNCFRGYEITRDLNSLYGLHFLYVFVTSFVGGTLNLSIIIRLHNAKGATSNVRYTSAVCWTIVQVLQVVNIVFGGGMLQREVRRMKLLVHKNLTLASDGSRLKLELQSFSLQLLQCPFHFTAAGFFRINSKLLIQLGLVVISNALFFVQIDKIKKRS